MKPMMRIVHWKLLSKVSPLNVRKKALEAVRTLPR